MEEKKNKVKEFWEENKEDIKNGCVRTLCTTVGIAVGYFVGRKATEARITTGLDVCIGANPNFETEFYKTMEILEERKK